EAHSFGVLGATGRGLAEAVGVEDDVDIIVGTFSKSLASIGGFAVGSEAMEVLRYGSRPYIFTASPSPSCIATVRSSLRTIATSSSTPTASASPRPVAPNTPNECAS
ncbi:aminotransferase class I/II-fold pyridoxal phosphate-dependent enzyme, partial [Escherichia coli]